MTARFQRTYPPRGRVFFDGGLNNKYERALIGDNESPECANVIFENGAVETRGGTVLLNSASVGSFSCDGLFTRNDDSSDVQTMVAWWNGSLHTYDGASTFTTVPSAVSVFTAGVAVTAAEYENYMYFGNGNSTPYKYGGDSDTFTRHGVPAPTTTATAGTAPSGTNLTGDFYYAVSYVNSNLVEGDISPFTSTFTAASEDIRLTSIPVAPQSFGVNSRRLYRTENGGSTLKLLTTLNDNTTTTYDDAVADLALSTTAPTDQGEPPNYSVVLFHQARLFCIDPSDQLVKYSEIGNPYVFKATSFLRLGDTSGDVPVGLSIYDNSLVVFCQNSTWIVYMASTADTDWQVIKVRSTYGSASPFSAFGWQNQVMFAATQNRQFVGFASLAGDTINPSTSFLTVSAAGSEMQSDRIEPDIFLVPSNQLPKINSMVYKNRAYISMAYGSGQSVNNRIYVFDFSISRLNKNQRASWVPWTGLNASHFTVLGDTLYYADANATGRVFSMNSSVYSDNGTAIDSYFWTKEFSGIPGQENNHKDFRYAQILYEKSGDWFMDFTVRADSDSGSGTQSQIDLNPGGSLWGTMVWGRDEWGGGQAQGELRKFISPARGKRVQFKFSNQNVAGQRFKIIGLNFVYINKGER